MENSDKANKNFWTDFLYLYQALPCLWDKTSEIYKSKQLRNAAYERLLRKLQEIQPTASQASVIEKIKYFRSNFEREMREKKRFDDKKSTLKDGYVPTIWYFNNLKFLENQGSDLNIFMTIDNDFDRKYNVKTFDYEYIESGMDFECQSEELLTVKSKDMMNNLKNNNASGQINSGENVQKFDIKNRNSSKMMETDDKEKKGNQKIKARSEAVNEESGSGDKRTTLKKKRKMKRLKHKKYVARQADDSIIFPPIGFFGSEITPIGLKHKFH